MFRILQAQHLKVLQLDKKFPAEFKQEGVLRGSGDFNEGDSDSDNSQSLTKQMLKLKF